MCPTLTNKTVAKNHLRERVVTIIKEHPDGSKETTITEDRSKKSSHIETTYSSHKWAVGASVGLSKGLLGEPIYGVRVERYIFSGASVGVYGRTSGEVGLSLTYSF